MNFSRQNIILKPGSMIKLACFAAFFVVVRSQCSLPLGMQKTWWSSYDRSTSVITVDFTSTAITYKDAAGKVTDSYNCEQDDRAIPLWYYKMSQTAKPNNKRCVDTFFTEQMLTQRVVSVAKDTSVERCRAEVKSSTPQILIKYPFDFSSASCGMPTGSYQTTYKVASPTENNCVNDKNSITTVGDNYIDIQTCIDPSNVNYYAPFKSRLTCVESVSPIIFNGDPLDGNIVILAYTEGGNTFFYCGRFYGEKVKKQIHISLGMVSKDTLMCEMDKNYTHVDAQSYRYLLLNPNQCEEAPCKNGGTCNQDYGKYTCTCVSGWTGTNCTEDVNECASNPCQNAGTCLNKFDSYMCTCVSGYAGNRCQTNINECASRPCQNGATCVDNVNGYTCSCASGFTGTACGTKLTFCAAGPCHNAGSCVEGTVSFICTCSVAFYGTVCEYKNSCWSNPCRNNGTCVLSGSSYNCKCEKGWFGVNCQAASGYNWVPLTIGLGLLAGLLLLFLLAVCCRRCCCVPAPKLVKRGSTRHKSTPTPAQLIDLSSRTKLVKYTPPAQEPVCPCSAGFCRCNRAAIRPQHSPMWRSAAVFTAGREYPHQMADGQPSSAPLSWNMPHLEAPVDAFPPPIGWHGYYTSWEGRQPRMLPPASYPSITMASHPRMPMTSYVVRSPSLINGEEIVIAGPDGAVTYTSAYSAVNQQFSYLKPNATSNISTVWVDK